MWKIKNGFFSCKNCLTLFVSGREEKRAFSCTLSVLAKKTFLAQNSVNQKKTIKIVVSAEIAQNQKWHLFLEKGVFLTWVKKWVLLTVFLKSCVLLKTRFYSVIRNTAFQKQNMYVEQNRNFMKNSGLFFLTWHNGAFQVSFFEALMLLWCLFGVSGIVPKVLKVLCFFFPSFWGFCGVGYFCLFGFRRFRCFGVLVFVFLFFVLVLFLFFCFVFV